MQSAKLIISAAVISSTLAGSATFAMPASAHNNTAKSNHKTSEKREHEKSSEKEHRDTICHATNSATNPYVKISVDYHSIVKNTGHHSEDDHAEGKKLPNKECEMPSGHTKDHDEKDCDKDKSHNGSTRDDDHGRKDDDHGTQDDHGGKDDHKKPEKEECDTTPTGGKGSSETPSTPSSPEPTTQSSPEPTSPVAEQPVKDVSGVATELPQTGATSLASYAVLLAGALAASITYSAQFLRNKNVLGFIKNL